MTWPSPRWLLVVLPVLAAAACTTSDPEDDGVCPCFETPADQPPQLTCEVADCGNVRDPADCEDEFGGCTASEVEVSNAEIVECVLDLLASGGEGTFARHSSMNGGQFSDTDHYLAHEGTVSGWTYVAADIAYSYTALRVRAMPDAAAVMPCSTPTAPYERWRCIEDAIAAMDVIETCGRDQS
jgi:hypothetical protein